MLPSYCSCSTFTAESDIIIVGINALNVVTISVLHALDQDTRVADVDWHGVSHATGHHPGSVLQASSRAWRPGNCEEISLCPRIHTGTATCHFYPL